MGSGHGAAKAAERGEGWEDGFRHGDEGLAGSLGAVTWTIARAKRPQGHPRRPKTPQGDPRRPKKSSCALIFLPAHSRQQIILRLRLAADSPDGKRGYAALKRRNNRAKVTKTFLHTAAFFVLLLPEVRHPARIHSLTPRPRAFSDHVSASASSLGRSQKTLYSTPYALLKLEPYAASRKRLDRNPLSPWPLGPSASLSSESVSLRHQRPYSVRRCILGASKGSRNNLIWSTP